MVDAQVLLSDYNYYRNHTHAIQKSKFKRELKADSEKLQALAAMASFCESHSADPRLWLYMLFKSKNWLYSPKFTQLVPKQKKTINSNLLKYLNLTDVPLFRKRVSDQISSAKQVSGKIFDPNHDISLSAESLKRRYLGAGDVERCMSETRTLTFGYHPRSLICARCPIATKCEAAIKDWVGFDISALRRDEITTQQAQQLVAYRHGG